MHDEQLQHHRRCLRLSSGFMLALIVFSFRGLQPLDYSKLDELIQTESAFFIYLHSAESRADKAATVSATFFSKWMPITLCFPVAGAHSYDSNQACWWRTDLHIRFASTFRRVLDWLQRARAGLHQGPRSSSRRILLRVFRYRDRTSRALTISRSIPPHTSLPQRI